MAAQKGKDLLIKIDISGSYTTIAGLRSSSISMNDEQVDITNKDSAGERVMLAQAGVRSVSVSGSGVFLDSASETSLKESFGKASFDNYQILVPDFGTFTGAFQLASLEYAGEYNGEATYSITLESAGAITFATV